MPKVLVSDSLSETAVQIFRDNNIDVDFLPKLGKDKDALLQKLANMMGWQLGLQQKLQKNCSALRQI